MVEGKKSRESGYGDTSMGALDLCQDKIEGSPEL